MSMSAVLPVDDLHPALRKMLPDVDWVTAGKLIAAKRPRLIPILDSRVSRVQTLLRSPQELFWVTLCDELSDEHRRATIADVCHAAPPHVSLLRRIDVALWMATAKTIKVPHQISVRADLTRFHAVELIPGRSDLRVFWPSDWRRSKIPRMTTRRTGDGAQE